MIKFLSGCIIQVCIILVSVFVILKTEAIARTANLFEMNNMIQLRTDAVFAVEMKREEFEKRNSIIIADGISEAIINNIIERNDIIKKERELAIYSLLNTYEFACLQYNGNKIDKEAFKSYYIFMIKYIKDEYGSFFNKYGYEGINDVYKEWHNE
jgi:hypothetical protein